MMVVWGAAYFVLYNFVKFIPIFAYNYAPIFM